MVTLLAHNQKFRVQIPVLHPTYCYSEVVKLSECHGSVAKWYGTRLLIAVAVGSIPPTPTIICVGSVLR